MHQNQMKVANPVYARIGVIVCKVHEKRWVSFLLLVLRNYFKWRYSCRYFVRLDASSL